MNIVKELNEELKNIKTFEELSTLLKKADENNCKPYTRKKMNLCSDFKPEPDNRVSYTISDGNKGNCKIKLLHRNVSFRREVL